MPRRLGLFLATVFLLAVVGCAGFFALSLWRDKVAVRQDLDRLETASKTVEAAPQKALNLFYLSRSEGYPADSREAWLRLQRDAYIQQKAFFELVGIFERNPHIILESELASILTHRVLSEGGYEDEAQEILERWKDQKDTKHDWLEAEIHAILSSGRRTDAVEMLGKRLQAEPTDIRTVLLAAQIAESPEERAAQLTIASSIDPDDLQLRLARADYFESTEQPRLALSEYNKALAAQPDDPRVIHLVSSFLLRHRSSEQALSIWENAAAKDPQSYVRAMSWQKLIRPASVELEMPHSENVEIKKLMNFLANLPAHSFFNEEHFTKIRSTTSWDLRLEEIYWLQLLELLRTERYESAYAKLQQTPPSIQSYNPGILRALHIALEFICFGNLDANNAPLDPSPDNTKPILYLNLDELVRLTSEHSIAESESKLLSPTIADNGQSENSEEYEENRIKKNKLEEHLRGQAMTETKSLFDRKLIIPAILVAGGWDEAALLIADGGISGDRQPEWFTIQWASALRKNRAPEEAILFLNRIEKRSSNEDLMLAELYLETSDHAKLRSITDLYRLELSEQGSKATSLAARESLARGKYNEAISIILENRTYSLSVSGHELAARIYLIAGDEAMAAGVLRRIRPYSAFAKAFLAAYHFRSGELEEAKQDVLELLAEMPEREVLRASLLQILKAQEEEQVTQ